MECTKCFVFSKAWFLPCVLTVKPLEVELDALVISFGEIKEANMVINRPLS